MGRISDRTPVTGEDTVPRLPMVPVAPVAAGVAAWAIAVYARTSLGGWRFLLVAPLTAYAVLMGTTFLVVGAAIRLTKSAGVPTAQADQADNE